jgi:uncharacterized peroxidase-related enzyme
MPRIRTVPPEQATGVLAEAYARLTEFGLPVVPAVFQLSSLRPDFARSLVDLYRSLFGPGALSRSSKEAITTYVSTLNQCPYCVGAHTFFMELHGASEEHVQAARAGDLSVFAADDEDVERFLPLAEKITRHAYKVTDEDVESLRSAGWSDEKILEAVFVVVAFNMINRLVDTLGIADADFEDDLRRGREAVAELG